MCWSGAVVLTQFELLTSGTSSGSAKVMSAHCGILLATVRRSCRGAFTYVVKSSAVLRKLNNLDCRIVANLGCEVGG
jgi:hypothetical protein